jgi:hypothetical protein
VATTWHFDWRILLMKTLGRGVLVDWEEEPGTRKKPAVSGTYECYDLDSTCRDVAHLEEGILGIETSEREWQKAQPDLLDDVVEFANARDFERGLGSQRIPDLRRSRS